jgi:hypothetical protein
MLANGEYLLSDRTQNVLLGSGAGGVPPNTGITLIFRNNRTKKVFVEVSTSFWQVNTTIVPPGAGTAGQDWINAVQIPANCLFTKSNTMLLAGLPAPGYNAVTPSGVMVDMARNVFRVTLEQNESLYAWLPQIADSLVGLFFPLESMVLCVGWKELDGVP